MKLLRVFILLSVFLVLMSCGSNNQKQENDSIKTPILLVEGNWHLDLNISYLLQQGGISLEVYLWIHLLLQ